MLCSEGDRKMIRSFVDLIKMLHIVGSWEKFCLSCTFIECHINVRVVVNSEKFLLACGSCPLPLCTLVLLGTVRGLAFFFLIPSAILLSTLWWYPDFSHMFIWTSSFLHYMMQDFDMWSLCLPLLWSAKWCLPAILHFGTITNYENVYWIDLKLRYTKYFKCF